MDIIAQKARSVAQIDGASVRAGDLQTVCAGAVVKGSRAGKKSCTKAFALSSPAGRSLYISKPYTDTVAPATCTENDLPRKAIYSTSILFLSAICLQTFLQSNTGTPALQIIS